MEDLSTRNDAPTIDEIDAENTPSLVGYWKCDQPVNGKVKDYSGNGYDLTIANTVDLVNSDAHGLVVSEAQRSLVLDNMWSRFPGYLSLGYSFGAWIPITEAPLLEGPTNQLIYGCELVDHGDTDVFGTLAADFDFGTYWFGSDSSNIFVNHCQPASGYNILAVAFATSLTNQTYGIRTDDGAGVVGGGGKSFSDIYPPGSYPVERTYGANMTMVGAHDPGVRTYYAHGNPTDNIAYYTTNTTTVPATLPAQSLDGVKHFALRSQNGYPPRWGVRNMYVWSAAALDAKCDIAITVKWLRDNPGRIPPWLVGK
ncbi:MAG: hypothetical protein KJO69_09685 [Gammaproteobacteria bacterium]|nr:hypothetical protein [Gammaproteobacteria bacterium]